MPSARRTAGAFRRETGTISFVPPSMISSSSPLSAALDLPDAAEVDHVPAVHPQEADIRQFTVELVQALRSGS